LVFLAQVKIPPYHYPPDVLVWRGRYFVPEGVLNRGVSYVEVIGAVVEEKA